MRSKKIMMIFALFFSMVVSTCQAERIKDIASLAGVRSNPLLGYGLVVGLDGTGDSTAFTGQTFRTMLDRLGITLPPGVNPGSKNIAAVAVNGDLPPFMKPGQSIDITVSSLGDAKSLRGGTLLFTPLKAADGHVYAVAQGNLVVGGLGISGQDGSKITVNIPVVGRIPNGAIVERLVYSPFAEGNTLTFHLHQPDFTTAKHVSDAVNGFLGDGAAQALDAATIEVKAPIAKETRVEYIAALENLQLESGEAAAKIVVNSRTGTIVVGNHVRIKPAAITHGNLIVSITERQNVSQPGAFSQAGTTQVTQQSTVNVKQERNRMFLFANSITLDDIVAGVNAVGAAPGDVVAILEALQQAGALSGALEII